MGGTKKYTALVAGFIFTIAQGVNYIILQQLSDPQGYTL
jgi:hypothetical protein